MARITFTPFPSYPNSVHFQTKGIQVLNQAFQQLDFLNLQISYSLLLV
jgi:hypothetical protein